MITYEDLEKIEDYNTVCEAGFKKLTIAQTFAVGRISRLTREYGSDFRWPSQLPEYLSEKNMENINKRIEKPNREKLKIDNELIRKLFFGLRKTRKLAEVCDKSNLAFALSYWHPFRETTKPDKRGLSGPRNSAFYDGINVQHVLEEIENTKAYSPTQISKDRVKLISTMINNIINVFYEEANTNEITSEFKEELAKEVYPLLLGQSLHKWVYEEENGGFGPGKVDIIRLSSSHAEYLADKYNFEKPPIYESLLVMTDIIDHNRDLRTKTTTKVSK
jgi:hypothetical protein